MRLIDADAFDERVRAAGGMSEEELSEDFKDGVQTVLYMMSKQPTITAQPDHDEWCHDCKEYDKEKHSCPRWNRVIRNTLKDAQTEIIRCKDCEYYELTEWVAHRCNLLGRSVYGNDFCAWAEPYKGEQDDDDGTD